MPESPRWLMGHGYEEGARQALEKIRYEDEIDSEMEKLMSETAQEMELGVATWREVFAKDNKMRYRLFSALVCRLFNNSVESMVSCSMPPLFSTSSLARKSQSLEHSS